jgi:hypothetical protein
MPWGRLQSGSAVRDKNDRAAALAVGLDPGNGSREHPSTSWRVSPCWRTNLSIASMGIHELADVQVPGDAIDSANVHAT